MAVCENSVLVFVLVGHCLSERRQRTEFSKAGNIADVFNKTASAMFVAVAISEFVEQADEQSNHLAMVSRRIPNPSAAGMVDESRLLEVNDQGW